MRSIRFILFSATALTLVASSAVAQGRGGPQVVSPEVHADRRVTFRITAPDAQKVEVRTPGDIPGSISPTGRGLQPFALTKNADGVWEATVGPVPAGAYRYTFVVNGVTVIDSRNPITSQTNTTVYSLVIVPGSDLFDTRAVPHGAGDVDESWSTVGRAGVILDNLIAARKAKPVIVVMPSGHVNGAGAALGAEIPAADDAFLKDFTADILPYVEKNYRVLTDRQNRAIAGLSMGGMQTLNIAIPHLDQFAYVGVFSSGILAAGQRGESVPFGQAWEQQNLAALDNASLKRGLKLLWFGTGKADFLIDTSRNSVALMKKHGFNPVFVESEGGHTWLNWRDYLSEFAPQLFR